MNRQIVLTEEEWKAMQQRVAFLTARLVMMNGDSPNVDFIVQARKQFGLPPVFGGQPAGNPRCIDCGTVHTPFSSCGVEKVFVEKVPTNGLLTDVECALLDKIAVPHKRAMDKHQGQFGVGYWPINPDYAFARICDVAPELPREDRVVAHSILLKLMKAEDPTLQGDARGEASHNFS